MCSIEWTNVRTWVDIEVYKDNTLPSMFCEPAFVIQTLEHQ